MGVLGALKGLHNDNEAVHLRDLVLVTHNIRVSRGVTDLHPSRGCTHPVTRAIEVSHAACRAEF